MGILDRFVVRQQKPSEEALRVARRLSVVPTSDLPSWIDNVISHTGASVDRYIATRDEGELKEARIGAQTLLELLDDLERRLKT
jgi:hypothetical protein